MNLTNKFTFYIDQLTEVGKSLLRLVEKHPWLFGISSILIVSGIVIIVVPIALGFSSTGPVAGSVAAAWQSSIGNVTAGSLFAILQSLTMNGTLTAVGGGLIGAGATVGLAASVDWANSFGWAKSVVWTEDGVAWAKDAVSWANGAIEWVKSAVVWAKDEEWAKDAVWAKDVALAQSMAWMSDIKMPIKH